MTISFVTFDPDDPRFPPGSIVYLGPSSSSSSSTSSSPARDCSSCIGGIITQRFSSTTPAHRSRLLDLRDEPRLPPIQKQCNNREIMSAHRQEVEIGRIIKYSLSPTTTMIIQKGDITKWFVDRYSDAIVNSTPGIGSFEMTGVNEAIQRAAGPEFFEACCKLSKVTPFVHPQTGQALITPAFKLPASRVIHTDGPIYDAGSRSKILLESAYRQSLSAAIQNNIQYIAFPAVSCGYKGFSLDEAATIAISMVKEFSNNFKEVHFVLLLDEVFNVWLHKASELLKRE